MRKVIEDQPNTSLRITEERLTDNSRVYSVWLGKYEKECIDYEEAIRLFNKTS